MNRSMIQTALICAALCVFAGCLFAGKEEQGKTTIRPSVGSTFCVMPFLKGRHALQTNAPLDLTLTCPVSGLCITQEDFLSDADRVMTRLAWQAAADRFGDAVVPLNDTASVYAEMDKNPTADTPLSLAKKLGAALNVDYVIAGAVWRFREREGYAASASRPASVAFAIYLVDVKQGSSIWAAAFDKTQQPLSENLLNVVGFFKQGAKWLTAEELAAVGVDTVFETFPEEK